MSAQTNELAEYRDTRELFYWTPKSLPARCAQLGMTPGERWVALYLLDLPSKDKTREAYKASRTIADDLGLTDRFVRRALKKFEKKGWLKLLQPHTADLPPRYDYSKLCQVVWEAGSKVTVRRLDSDNKVTFDVPVPDDEEQAPEVWPCRICGAEYARASAAMKCAVRCHEDQNAAATEVDSAPAEKPVSTRSAPAQHPPAPAPAAKLTPEEIKARVETERRRLLDNGAPRKFIEGSLAALEERLAS